MEVIEFYYSKQCINNERPLKEHNVLALFRNTEIEDIYFLWTVLSGGHLGLEIRHKFLIILRFIFQIK